MIKSEYLHSTDVRYVYLSREYVKLAVKLTELKKSALKCPWGSIISVCQGDAVGWAVLQLLQVPLTSFAFSFLRCQHRLAGGVGG